jgi:SAM-dependent methyltransferase
MPTSEAWQIPWVCDVIARQAPRTVIDMGAGYGKYGMLVREFAPGVERVDAVDVSPPRYAVYDHVYLGDIRRLGESLPADAPRYDLALFLDVLEHLEKPQGWMVLEDIASRAARVLVTTPWGFRPQEIPGMPFETHRSGWYPWEFGRRMRVHAWSVFPGHFTRHLRLPRLWQVLALVSARG